MDYGNLKEALELIKRTCNDSKDCDNCPLGNSDGRCLVTDETPTEWQIIDEQIIRLLK